MESASRLAAGARAASHGNGRHQMASQISINNRMNQSEWLLLLLLSVLWGGSFFFAGILVKTMPPFTIVFLRVGLAAHSETIRD